MKLITIGLTKRQWQFILDRIDDDANPIEIRIRKKLYEKTAKKPVYRRRSQRGTFMGRRRT